MGDALATYGSALLILVVSAGLGAGIQAACGGRRYSPVSVAVGFAAALVVAWWAVRLPGEGVTALLVLAVLAITGAVFGTRRLSGFDETVGPAALTLLGAFLVASIPFVAEGHFGILGTGFNVDMSQHLFAASWLAEQTGATPNLYEQGYPLGPHALAVATEVISGNLALSFTGLTLVLPALAALTVLGCFRLGDRRGIPLALLTAFAYLAASWYAQGSFKELAETVLLLALVAWLRSLVKDREEAWPRTGPTLAIPAALLAAGSLYAYSGPGLAWLAGTLIVWAAIELLTDRERAITVGRRLLVPAAVAAVALLVLAAPELTRIADFGANVGTVAERSTSSAPLLATEAIAADGDSGSKYNDDLGNLFGQINPLQVFGVWPSGDFRVLPGDGSVPAPVFWLGSLLGALAFALGIRRIGHERDAVLAAVVLAAAAIWLATRIGSTPYTAAKALQILAVPVMLVSLLGALSLFGPSRKEEGRSKEKPRTSPTALIAFVFVVGAAFSSGLALGNAPVGPSEYSNSVRSLAPRFEGVPTQLLAPAGELANRHGRDFYGWELRGARRTCIEAIPPTGGGAPPPGVRLVLVVGDGRPPYGGLIRVGAKGDVVVWRVKEPDGLDQLIVDPENPTVCTAG